MDLKYGTLLIFEPGSNPFEPMDERIFDEPKARMPRFNKNDYSLSPDADPLPVTKERVKTVNFGFLYYKPNKFIFRAPYQLNGPRIERNPYWDETTEGEAWYGYFVYTKSAMKLITKQYPLLRVAYDVLLATVNDDPQRHMARKEDLEKHYENCVNR